ncbi:MAG TPA: alpha/beta fold hydrolase [Steroidobacteraceae bacterium]|nr:alpha/beta fold hydrolase [Steroidobacteraceae bacterium]
MSAAAARPLYFGSGQRPLFGWLHPAAYPQRNVGVVLCSPSGYEAICTHRTYRRVAESAAAQGFPALRFDYDGTGDSAGHALDGDRVAHWLRSITAAIDTLKATTGVEKICLFGVRVGASLAAIAAQGRGDVHAMIAFAPVIKVNSYLREIRALSLARQQSAPPPELNIDPELQEAAGFTTTAETRAALGAIDLAKLEAAPAPHILVLERDDMSSSDAWPKKLAALGAAVEQRPLTGYVDMMRDAHAAKPPTIAIATALEWLTARDGVMTATHDGDTGEPTTQLVEGEALLRETATYLDAERLLFGIVSEPAHPGAPRDVVVLLNSGTIHHIGPSRVYVTIARSCAARGVPAIRIDLSGVGDSGLRPGEKENSPYADSARTDIREAVEFAARRYPGARLHLIGLCSGAYHGLKAAVAGLPLRSVVVVNPLTFFWKPGMPLDYADFQITSESKRYARSAGSLSSWLKLLRGRVDLKNAWRVLSKRIMVRAKNSGRDLARMVGMNLEDDLASELRRVARQRTEVYFVFSASDPGHSMLLEQGGRIVRKLQRNGNMRISIVEGADHTFTSHWNRDQLLALLMAHLARHDGSA